MALCFLVGVFSATIPLSVQAGGRDSDASRMQARKVTFPSSYEDTLNPPDDRIDWRYFKLSQATHVTISVAFGTPDVSGEVRLMSATGHEIASTSAQGASVALTRQLEPGVYYVSVTASAQTSYTLSLR